MAKINFNKWTKINKATRGTGGGASDPIMTLNKKGNVIRFNNKALATLQSRHVKLYISEAQKLVAVVPVATNQKTEKDTFSINTSAKTISSRELVDGINLKHLPKKLKGEWNTESQALIFDYSKNMVKENIFD